MRAVLLRVRALGDLAQRYARVLGAAWRHRAELEPSARLPHEAEFLPAALALQETPPSPAPRVAAWLLVACAACAVAWAVLGEVDVVATATGKIVPGSRSKVIQPLEPAKVRAIHVLDGQEVRAGDVLVELDATSAAADRERIGTDLAAARLHVARANALLEAIARGTLGTLPRPESVDADAWHEARRLLEGQHREFTARLALIDAERAKREAERRSTAEAVRKLERTAPISRQLSADYRAMVEKDLVPKHEALERERERIEQEGELEVQRGRVQEIDARLEETRAQRDALVAETRRRELDAVTEGLQRAAALEQELLKADTRERLMRLVSPVDGTVQQLAIHTIGGVVTAAQPLMVIVPRDGALEVEAFVENRDVGFVHAGLPAEVKVETFQYTKYGTVPATVTMVTDDAIPDEKRGLIYAVRVKMHRSWIDVDGKQLHLNPGMAVAVEVKTSRRRVIEYFLAPLLQYGHESLRER
jgi:hemolysin D